ncbi:MAG: radical SAM protein [bacterium]
MSRSVDKLLFLQLPCIDSDTAGARENVYLAAHYLRWTLERRRGGHPFDVVIPPPETDLLDDSNIIEYILGVKPDVICATLYLWNIERTLGILERIKAGRKGLMIAVGGPEVAPDHPFLFTSGIPDVAVTGEGEPVIAPVLEGLRVGRRPVLPATAWKTQRGYKWGPPGPLGANLTDILPPPWNECNRPFDDGVGYLETGRGCPLRCTFCCYNQRRRTASYLAVDDVVRRVSVLCARGAREIRFVDPTFNSNPDFELIVTALAMLNRRKTLKFFAEVRAETITARQAELLSAANFTDIEVGVQSRDKAVLRLIRRPTALKRLDHGVGLLAARGIRLTVDVMCGLPGQGMSDMLDSVRWAASIPKARVQFLHTLLLPGTELRDRRSALGLTSQELPPYRVVSTRRLSAEDIAGAEAASASITGTTADNPTMRFVGSKLPDLFGDRMEVDLTASDIEVSGRSSRRALVFRGEDLYALRDRICLIIECAIKAERHILWQFVLAPGSEEPLDLLDEMIATIDSVPPTYLDRWVVDGRRASRRVLILLNPDRQYSRSWINAAEDLLAEAFH